jgi:hypothetical protein
MRIHRKALYLAIVTALVMAAPLAAHARPGAEKGHGGPHRGPGMEQSSSRTCPGAMMQQGWMHAIPQEKREAVFAVLKEHRAKTQELREQLWVKRTTLEALSGNPKVEPSELVKLVTEMSALRIQLKKERVALAERIEKEFGIQMPSGKGFGMGHGPKGFKGHGGHGGHGGY